MENKTKSERDNATKNDNIIRETFQKLAQVILQARIVFPITPLAEKRINKWFNLEIEEIDSITRNMVSSHNNMLAPLFLEVYFSSPEPTNHPDYTPLMERWKIAYQPSVGTTSIEYPTVYKHLVLLVRGVAGLLRVMPAFRAFRNCQKAKAAGQIGTNAEIRYSLHASFPSSREFAASRATADFTFDPVISPLGSLTVSVVYRTDCSVEIGATDPIIKAHFIKDYSPYDNASTSPPKKIYTQESAPYRSAPIGIPGSPPKGLYARETARYRSPTIEFSPSKYAPSGSPPKEMYGQEIASYRSATIEFSPSKNAPSISLSKEMYGQETAFYRSAAVEFYPSTSPPKEMYGQESPYHSTSTGAPEFSLYKSPPPPALRQKKVTAPKSHPIGIPGKDAPMEPMIPFVSSPPSSLTMMSPAYFTDPAFSQPQQSTPPSTSAIPFRPNSLPNQYQFGPNPISTSPVGIPSSSNRPFSQPAFSSSPTSSGNGGFGQGSAGGTFGHTHHTFNSTSTSTSTNSTSTSGGSINNSNSNPNVNNSGKLRPRAASYAPPSTISPPSGSSALSGTPPYSHSLYSRMPYSTSPSKEPYSTSPTHPYSHSPSPSSSPLASTSPQQRPATNMYMSSLLGPSVHQPIPSTSDVISHDLGAFDELAFAGSSEINEKQLEAMGDKGEMGDIGEFVRMCKTAPPLKMFSPDSKKIVGSSFLFAEMTTSQITHQLTYFSLDPIRNG